MALRRQHPRDLIACTVEEALEMDDTLPRDALGIFTGAPWGSEPMGTEEMPRIYLFTDALWEECGGDPATYAEEVRITLLHELAHYLGLDEDEVEARGLG
jgi:predicted Zn-dependent protease with MMP-like domain